MRTTLALLLCCLLPSCSQEMDPAEQMCTPWHPMYSQNVEDIYNYVKRNNLVLDSLLNIEWCANVYYHIVASGNSAKPVPGSVVTYDYTVKDLENVILDMTDQNSGPSRHDIGNNGRTIGVINGLQLIGEGGSITLLLPAVIGSGDIKYHPKITPGSVLIFELHLLKVA
ncbi:MAG: FKBP-type peptidyl-prolyl cis-trans isomerase [Saprospiraceae bacterium]|nr:FKBP-type peptidyl-prolyl cis-trans isomerase [Saprospiraceae bacterium]